MVKYICLLLVFVPSLSFSKDVYVNGYTRKDGTYVEGHYRTRPNGTVNDNFSTYGNVNPYTGEVGTKGIYDKNLYYAPVQNNQIYQEKYEIIKYEASCKTNDGEIFFIEFDENVLIAKGKYKAFRKISDSNAWASYSNQGYNYSLGNFSNEKMPIKVVNNWGKNSVGSCVVKQSDPYRQHRTVD